jgi:hypothetical protein
MCKYFPLQRETWNLWDNSSRWYTPKTKIKQTDKTKQNTNKKGMSIAETIVYIIIP